jgi:hypothetical protein
MNDSFPTGSFDPLDGIIADYLQALERGIFLSAGTASTASQKLRALFHDVDAVGRDASKFRL